MLAMSFPILRHRNLVPPVPPTPGTLNAIQWYRADSVTTTGALIDTWVDLSPNAYTMVLSGGNVNTRATFLPTGAPNSQPSAQAGNPFSGVTCGYHCTTFNETIQQIGGQWSMFIVCKPDINILVQNFYRNAYGNCSDTTQTDDGNVFRWDPFGGDEYRMGFFSSGSQFGGGTAPGIPGDWTYLLACCDWSGIGELNIYQLGGLYQNQTPLTSPLSSRTCTFSTFLRNVQGGINLTNFTTWFGEVADFSLFDYALDGAGVVDQLNTYVGDRYGAPMIANASGYHPYSQPRFKRKGRIYVPEGLSL